MFRGFRKTRRRQRLYRVQFRPRSTVGDLRIRSISTGGRPDGDTGPPHRDARTKWGICDRADDLFRSGWPCPSRPLRRHRRNRWHQILLGTPPPARQARFPSSRLLCAGAWGTGRRMTLSFGIDRLLAEPDLRKPLEGRRVALLAHPASVTADLTHSLDALVAAGVNVTAVFGPQHGVRGDLQDNMMESPDFTDPTYGMPVFSLYGEVRRPTGQSMHMFDVMLVDLQDLGCRIYTYVTTLLYMLEAAAQHGKAVWVLDRPNPAGRPVEGTRLRAGWESFVGAGPMMMRHGLTMGEMGHWFIRHFGLNVEYRVIEMAGWEPDAAPGFGWPPERLWINPSPNAANVNMRSEEHTSEIQSLMRNSYAVFCLKNK